MQIGHKHAAPRFRIAALMAMAGASAQYARNEEQALLTLSDVSAMATKHMKYIQQAEGIIEKARKMIDMADSNQRLALYTLEVRLVHHVFRKADATRGTFKTQAAVASQFVAELSHLLGQPMPDPWGSRAPAKSAGAAAPSSSKDSIASSSGVVQFNPDGEVANTRELLACKGYEIGGAVVRVQDKARFKIKAFLESSVEIEDSVGATIHVFSSAFFEGKLKSLQKEKDVEYMPDPESAAPGQNADWKQEMYASRVKLALDAMHKEHAALCKDLQIVVEPAKSRSVFAARKFDGKEVLLVPATPEIVMKKAEDGDKKLSLLALDYEDKGKKATMISTRKNRIDCCASTMKRTTHLCKMKHQTMLTARLVQVSLFCNRKCGRPGRAVHENAHELELLTVKNLQSSLIHVSKTRSRGDACSKNKRTGGQFRL